MTKPDKCSKCNNTELTYKKQHTIFDPDTEEEQIHDCWICDECETIFYETDTYNVFQFEIKSKKNIQQTETNVSLWGK